jgi:hypothetical protein
VKLQGYRETFYEFSGKLSDICRQLAFAGIGLIWLFKKDNLAGLSVPHELLLPGALIVAALTFDLLQYALGSILWRVFYRNNEKLNTSEDEELTHGTGWELPIWIMFCLKTLCMVAAYGFLLDFFVRSISFR